MARFKVRYNVVNDLDYYPYPKKFLFDKVNIDNDSLDEEVEREKYKAKKAKQKIMSKALVNYAKAVKKKQMTWPSALL
jgi:hypothetical protein